MGTEDPNQCSELKRRRKRPFSFPDFLRRPAPAFFRSLGSQRSFGSNKTMAQSRSSMEKLPMEVLLMIVSYINPSMRTPLKLAGSHYITEVVRNARPVSFREYLIAVRETVHLTGRMIATDLAYAAASGNTNLTWHLLNTNKHMTDSLSLRVAMVSAIEYKQPGTISMLPRFKEASEMGQLRWVENARNPVYCYPWTVCHEAVCAEDRPTLEAVLQWLGHESKFLTKIRKTGHVRQKYKRYHWETALHVAAWIGNEELVKLLLDYNAYIDYSCECKYGENCTTCPCRSDDSHFSVQVTPLHVASSRPRLSMIEMLLSNGANVHKKESKGKSALHYAAQQGVDDIILTLISHGANVNDRDTRGRTALWYAVSHDKISAVRILLDHGATVNQIDLLQNSLTRPDVAELLVSNGMEITDEVLLEVNRRDGSWQTLEYMLNRAPLGLVDRCMPELLFASANRYFSTRNLQILLTRATESNIAAHYDRLLKAAAENSRIPLLMYLTAPNLLRAPKRETALRLALLHALEVNSTWPLAIKFLLEAEGTESDKSIRVSYALNTAVHFDRLAIVRQILKDFCPNLEQPASIPSTPIDLPLHIAANEHKYLCHAMLLQSGAKVNATDSRARTPLHYVALSEEGYCVGELLKHGADVSIADNEGKTPLHYAALTGNSFVVEPLLENGADITIRDYSGQSPDDYVRNLGIEPDSENYSSGNRMVKAIFTKYKEKAKSLGMLDGEILHGVLLATRLY